MKKLLLVEDDLNLQEIYRARLTAEGYEVAVASDGEAALATAVQQKPDALILDIMMPKISGFDVLDIIRSTPEVKDTKVIILTALSQEGDRERGQKLGADKYLIKSQITLEDVINAVHEVLGEKVEKPEAEAAEPSISPPGTPSMEPPPPTPPPPTGAPAPDDSPSVGPPLPDTIIKPSQPPKSKST